MIGATEPTGLIGWVSQYGNVVFFFGQLIYWAITAFAVVWATMQFTRLVNAKVGRLEPPAPPQATVAVEEFVE